MNTYGIFQMVLSPSVKKIIAGSQREEPLHGKGHEEGNPTKRKGVMWLQGFPLSFPEHLPPKNQSWPDFIVLCFSTLLTLSGKVNLELQSSAFERSVSAQTPLMANLPYLDFYNYACDCLQPPNCERHCRPQT